MYRAVEHRTAWTMRLAMEDSADDLTTSQSDSASQTGSQKDDILSIDAALLQVREEASQSLSYGEMPGDGSFDCHICLELAQDPVVTLCGHLFCWPCLYRWLELHSISKECPVCKAGVSEEKVIPLYGRGKIGSADPRTKPVLGIDIPHRPVGLRTDNPHTVESPFSLQDLEFWHGTEGDLGADSFARMFRNDRHEPSPRMNEQREVLLYRIYILLVCMVIAFVLFF